jgi:predicted nucleic acid-binding protein
MRAALIDTGPLYALVDPDDQYHSRAQQELERLIDERRSLVVAWPTLLEAYSLILRRMGPRTAHRWHEQTVAGVDLLNPHRDDYAAAFHRLQALADQSITLFDAVVAVLSEQLELPVWTYDHHFAVMRIPVWR